MEITRKNFVDELINVKQDLSKCCFVGFDAEFTALLTGECFKYRLFDTGEDRYNKIKNEVSKMIMTQVGLTFFEYDRNTDLYIANGYTFHLCPQGFGDIDQSFIFQASTLKFLCQHKFDFNKFTYEGLPYLSKAEESRVRQQLKDGVLLKDHARALTIDEENQLQQYCSEVSKWLIQNEEYTLYLDVESPVLRYLTHMEIRMRFPKVLTTDSLGNSKKVLVYRNESVAGANSAPESQLQENLVTHLLGFSQVIALLEACQKPIVGHNMFLDTVLLHNQFIGPLPQEYSTFKKNIHKSFPFLFDTKYISYEMSRKLNYHEVWKSNKLQDLYEFFSQGKCKQLRKGVSLIRLSQHLKVNQTYHEAGWDSFCSGYCLIRLGHWLACENRGSYTTVGPTETLRALAPFCNKVNVIRGAISYMSFAGNDPPPHRPPWLHVRALAQRTINIGQVASELSGYGNIDVKPHGRRTALVAAVTHQAVDNILKNFRHSKEYRISKYNVYRHSAAGTVVIWSGALITGSLMLYLIHKQLNNLK